MTMDGRALWPRPVFVPLKANRKRLNKSYGTMLLQHVKACRYERSMLMLLHQQGSTFFILGFVCICESLCWVCTSILCHQGRELKERNERPRLRQSELLREKVVGSN